MVQQEFYPATIVVLSLATLPFSFGVFQIFWALHRPAKRVRTDGERVIYRLSDAHRRRRLLPLFLLSGIVLAASGGSIILLTWWGDLSLHLSAGLIFGFIAAGCVALIWRRMKRDLASGIVLDAESVTLLQPGEEQRLLKSQVEGAHLAAGRVIALEGSDLPWLRQTGRIILKPADPHLPDMKLPPGLQVDAHFDAWIASVPVVGSPALADFEGLTVGDVGPFATPLRGGAQSGLTAGLLIFALLAVYCLLYLSAAEPPSQVIGFDPATLLAFGGAEASLVLEQGQWFRLISAVFVHRNLSDLLHAVLFLAFAASAVERLIGSLRALALFLICAAFSSLASILMAPPEFVFVGASGAVFGLLGFLFGGFVRPPVAPPASWAAFMAAPLILCASLPEGYLLSLAPGYFGADHGGNLAGLLCGLLLGLGAAAFSSRAWPALAAPETALAGEG